MLIAKTKSLKNALHSMTVFQNYNIIKIGKSNETYQLNTRKRKYQQLIPIPKTTSNARVDHENTRLCKGSRTDRRTGNTRFFSRPFLHREQKHFVDLGLTVRVPAANYSFVLLVDKTHFKKLAD